MKAKGIYLFLLILLPVLIFLFLKSFGKNQFDIPVFYDQGIGDTLQQITCMDRRPQTYVAENPLLKKGAIKVVHFEDADGPVLKTRLEELEKVQDIFYDKPNIQLTSYLKSPTIGLDHIQGYNQRIQFLDQFWHFAELDSNAWSQLKQCNMVMAEDDNRVVLVDEQNRIRGYYNIMTREETDRLILEIRILEAQENE